MQVCKINIDEKWVEQPENTRKIIIREDFDKDGIMNDFYKTLGVIN
jgi:purine nucleosidase